MTYGPCGGVQAVGRCELGNIACPFASNTTARTFVAEQRPGTADLPIAGRRPSAVLDRARTQPVVVTDLSVAPFDPGSIASVAAILRGSCDAVLVGEYQDRPDFPPTVMAALLSDAGLLGWVTLTCRDRNRLVLEQEIAGLNHTGADAVLCVTGDIRAPGVRPGVTQVFDLDGTRLAAMAASSGIPAAVAESPSAPPTSIRPERLLQKQRAGAAVCILNHVAQPDKVGAFVDAARRVGVTIPIIASVALYTDEVSARVLQRFPGLDVDTDTIERVLAAPDPYVAGMAIAEQEAAALLEIEGINGVNISGLASGQGLRAAATAKATLGRAIRAATHLDTGRRPDHHDTRTDQWRPR